MGEPRLAALGLADERAEPTGVHQPFAVVAQYRTDAHDVLDRSEEACDRTCDAVGTLRRHPEYGTVTITCRRRCGRGAGRPNREYRYRKATLRAMVLDALADGLPVVLTWSRSPGESWRWAVRARWSAADAP